MCRIIGCVETRTAENCIVKSPARARELELSKAGVKDKALLRGFVRAYCDKITNEGIEQHTLPLGQVVLAPKQSLKIHKTAKSAIPV